MFIDEYEDSTIYVVTGDKEDRYEKIRLVLPMIVESSDIKNLIDDLCDDNMTLDAFAKRHPKSHTFVAFKTILDLSEQTDLTVAEAKATELFRLKDKNTGEAITYESLVIQLQVESPVEEPEDLVYFFFKMHLYMASYNLEIRQFIKNLELSHENENSVFMQMSSYIAMIGDCHDVSAFSIYDLMDRYRDIVPEDVAKMYNSYLYVIDGEYTKKEFNTKLVEIAKDVQTMTNLQHSNRDKFFKRSRNKELLTSRRKAPIINDSEDVAIRIMKQVVFENEGKW